MTGLVTAWLAEVVLISYRATRKGANEGTSTLALPLPSQFVGSFAIYGVLGLLPDSASTFASLVGWGLVAATFLNLYQPLKQGQTTPTVAKSGTQTAAGNTAA
jgi:hypothetical protein